MKCLLNLPGRDLTQNEPLITINIECINDQLITINIECIDK